MYWGSYAANSEIRSLIEQYSPSDVFNFDETALFYDLPPSKTLSTVRNNAKKRVKSRVTVALCCNASGSEKMEPMIIGKLKNPRCFKGVNIEKRGIVYAASSNSWMTFIILDKWMQQLNLWMHGRKVLLLLDNGSSHKFQRELNNANVVFFFA